MSFINNSWRVMGGFGREMRKYVSGATAEATKHVGAFNQEADKHIGGTVADAWKHLDAFGQEAGKVLSGFGQETSKYIGGTAATDAWKHLGTFGQEAGKNIGGAAKNVGKALSGFSQETEKNLKLGEAVEHTKEWIIKNPGSAASIAASIIVPPMAAAIAFPIIGTIGFGAGGVVAGKFSLFVLLVTPANPSRF